MKTGIVIFAFGTPADLKSNRTLAETALGYGMPVIAQTDLIELPPEIDVTPIHDGPERFASTLEIASVSAGWAVGREIRTLIVIAAPPHKARCKRDLEKVIKQCGFDIKVEVCGDLPDNSEVWFSDYSLQTRTRNRLVWWMREIILRTMPFAVYKKVAA